ncbi:necdin-like 2 [Neoarius graeffei]|uniref:necdin-like 2 n=1 Tax=Neoarius graeffei TaxID=443677 RepID=UPI00298D1F33|nr:necdin-like 2 [Neoarius graeffei]
MAQNKRVASQSRRAQVVIDEDDEGSLTQPTVSQLQKARENFTPVQVDRKVAEVVQFILIKDQKKIPLRRTDIVKHVMKEYRILYQDIMKRAARTFEQVFGLKLVEIDSKNHIYILTNKLEPSREEPISMCPANPKTGLLFVILSVIFMKGGSVKEALVWNTLKKLRVDVGEKHEEFGDVKKIITDEFVRQKYLEYVRIPHTEPMEHEFRWGPRADAEVSKLRMLHFIAELHDQEPQSWTQQYREAMSAENSQR